MTVVIDDVLLHYGVKGMKWGRRKDNRTYATEDKVARKASRKAVQNVAAESWEKRWTKTEITKDEYDKMSTGKEFVQRGSTLKRITMDPSTTLAGQTYVSRLKEDADLYRAVLPAQNSGKIFLRTGKKSYKKNYELEMTTVKKLSSPSEKERVDIFIELLGTPAVKLPGRKKTITGREMLKRAGYGYELKNLSDQEAGLKFYTRFNSTAGNEKDALNKAYFDEVKRRGYNAISDDNDRYFLTKAPLILLDPEGTVKVKSVRALTADEINQTQRKLLPMDGEKK